MIQIPFYCSAVLLYICRRTLGAWTNFNPPQEIGWNQRGREDSRLEVPRSNVNPRHTVEEIKVKIEVEGESSGIQTELKKKRRTYIRCTIIITVYVSYSYCKCFHVLTFIFFNRIKTSYDTEWIKHHRTPFYFRNKRGNDKSEHPSN